MSTTTASFCVLIKSLIFKLKSHFLHLQSHPATCDFSPERRQIDHEKSRAEEEALLSRKA